jgi:hypothetical protein
MYQTLYEDEAMEIALRDSLDMFQSSQEEEDLALAIQLSLVKDKEQENYWGDRGTPSFF